MDTRISLQDGRKIGIAEFGEPAGIPMIYCHGFPTSRLDALLIEAAAIKHKMRLIAVDRPGYGLSDFKKYRQLNEWTQDICELLNILAISQCLVLAVSGGAPYALACAYKIPSRVLAVGIISGLGPVFEPSAVKQMKWIARFGFCLARNAPWLLGVLYGRLSSLVLLKHTATLQKIMMYSSPQADQSVLENEFVKYVLLTSMREAVKQGPDGALQDFVLFSKSWGIKLEEIAVNTMFWHGTLDRTVPASQVTYYTERLRRAEVKFILNEGHVSLPVRHIDNILGDMKALCSKD